MSSTTRVRPLALTAIAMILAVAAAFGAVAVVRATDSPGFCRSACHEMVPYHAAWSAGPHADVSCVECHVDPGAAAGLSHKLVALGEVKTHVFGDPTFPSATPADVPNARCQRCHATVENSKGFDHAQHAKGRDCTDCHSDTGHRVSASALARAGVLGDASATALTASRVRATALATSSVVTTGHVTVACSECHDISRTSCSTCHEPRHDAVTLRVDTTECTHCHRPGIAWAFRHPARTADCTSCHSKPTDHVATTATCLTCHRRVGESWAFAHPRRGANCTRCHTRPAGHRSGSCATCHRTGVSWAYSHPSSASCASCHRAPAGHFGSTCASCHRPGRAWSSAAFRHPGVPGGEHSYRSFACRSCHPSGYGSHSCTGCHEQGGGDDD